MLEEDLGAYELFVLPFEELGSYSRVRRRVVDALFSRERGLARTTERGERGTRRTRSWKSVMTL